jgi:hypothetical protein
MRGRGGGRVVWASFTVLVLYDAEYPTNDLPREKIVIFNGIVIFIYIKFYVHKWYAYSPLRNSTAWRLVALAI